MRSLRLVFEVIRDEIQIAEIQEIVDYHYHEACKQENA